jgi:hypothetical protein
MVTVLGAGLIAAAVVAAACRSRPGDAARLRPAAGDTAAAAGRPRLLASPPAVDMGAIAFDEEATARITLRNEGQAPLEIKRVERSRFCAPGPLPPRLPAGGSAPLVVTCRADLEGPLRERLVVRTDDPDASAFAIEVIGKVIPSLAFDVASIDITTAFGQTRAAEARLVGRHAAAARLSLVSPVPRDISVEHLDGTAGAPQGVRLRCRARASGTHVGHLAFTTALAGPREIGLSWACRVKGTLTVVPDTVSFDLVDGRARPQIVEVRSVQPGFALRPPRVARGPFAARLDPDHPGRIEISFTGLPAGADRDAHGVSGTLVVISNDRSEPRREVPLLGFGRAAPRRASDD